MLLNTKLLNIKLLNTKLLNTKLLNNYVLCNLCNSTGLLSWKYNNNLFLDTFKQQKTYLYTTCYKCQGYRHQNSKCQ